MSNQVLRENLKRFRKEHRMTQEAVAKRIGINPKTYANYESGVAEPSIETLRKLAVLYRITLDEMLSAGGSVFTAADVEILEIIKGNPGMAALFRNMNKMTTTELATVIKMLSNLADER